MSEIVKICKVHGELTKEQVRKSCKYMKCKICCRISEGKSRDKINERMKEYYRKNKEILLLKHKKYKKYNKDKAKIYRKNHYEKNKINILDSSNKRSKEDTITLSKRYLKSLIRSKGFLKEEITEELLEFIKSQLMLKRKIRELKECQTKNLSQNSGNT